jgi:antitoxin component YwqK of YwqJK toxin-antitoxin module
MKHLLLSFFLFTGSALHAQYYYKDIIGTRESSDLIKTYQKTGVTGLSVNSYDANDTRNDAFFIAQTFSKPHAVLRTTTRNGDEQQSVLTSYADSAGRIQKTVDSSANLTSITEYTYNNNGQLHTIKSVSTDSSKRLNETEVHQWQYNSGQVQQMLRIVNNKDTTVVQFKVEGGNVVEEQSTRRGVRDTVYYYYDAQNRLTDIVRFSAKAKRLLPEYMFEYAADGKVIQKITVPANSSDYLIWRYQYNAEGLKIKEAVYDRYKTLTGKIEYQYQRG